MPEPERRSVCFDRVAIRGRTDSLGFKGHAALYGSRTWIGPPKFGFWEEIAKGAFTRAVTEDDVRFLIDHDTQKVLARSSNGTLRLAEDRKGLAVDADMADVSYARDLAVLLERGDISEMSFAFVPATEEWSRLKDGTDLRRIVDIETLYDVSAVTFPAYDGTDASLRAVEARRKESSMERLSAIRRRLEALKGA